MNRRHRRLLVQEFEREHAGGKGIPVQLRTDLVVHLSGIPWNMTKRETRKLIAVIAALENEVPLPVSRRLPPPAHSDPP